MTTTITVNVNGDYIATVHQDDKEPVTIDGSSPETYKAFTLTHPANSTFVIRERPIKAEPD